MGKAVKKKQKGGSGSLNTCRACGRVLVAGTTSGCPARRECGRSHFGCSFAACPVCSREQNLRPGCFIEHQPPVYEFEVYDFVPAAVEDAADELWPDVRRTRTDKRTMPTPTPVEEELPVEYAPGAMAGERLGAARPHWRR